MFCTGAMDVDVKAEQRSYIKFFVEIRKTPAHTRDLSKQRKRGKIMSIALDYPGTNNLHMKI
jgi:hypothetical protein